MGVLEHVCDGGKHEAADRRLEHERDHARAHVQLDAIGAWAMAAWNARMNPCSVPMAVTYGEGRRSYRATS